jgi:hypothetical protein
VHNVELFVIVIVSAGDVSPKFTIPKSIDDGVIVGAAAGPKSNV